MFFISKWRCSQNEKLQLFMSFWVFILAAWTSCQNSYSKKGKAIRIPIHKKTSKTTPTCNEWWSELWHLQQTIELGNRSKSYNSTVVNGCFQQSRNHYSGFTFHFTSLLACLLFHQCVEVHLFIFVFLQSMVYSWHPSLLQRKTCFHHIELFISLFHA